MGENSKIPLTCSNLLLKVSLVFFIGVVPLQLNAGVDSSFLHYGLYIIVSITSTIQDCKRYHLMVTVVFADG